jgi:hypothetical protein
MYYVTQLGYSLLYLVVTVSRATGRYGFTDLQLTVSLRLLNSSGRVTVTTASTNSSNCNCKDYGLQSTCASSYSRDHLTVNDVKFIIHSYSVALRTMG